MSEETISTTLFTESPASWNTRYVTNDGFTCQLTLRAESGKDLLQNTGKMVEVKGYVVEKEGQKVIEVESFTVIE